MKTIRNEELLSALKSANSVFLCTHVAPDGDAIGCLLAAGHLLEKMGKTVVMASSDPVPAKFMMLPGADRILPPAAVSGVFDTAFSLDASDLPRTGDCRDIYMSAPVRLQIDHHGTNPGFAMINEIDADAPAAGVIVARLVRALGVPFDRDIAACLYTAICTDTGNFIFPGVNAETFEIMSLLMETGFPMSEYAVRLNLMREREYLGLLQRALSRLTFLYDGRVTLTRLEGKDYEECHALPEHSDSIVNYGLYIPGVCLTCFADGRLSGVSRFSFRALPPYSAVNVAVRLGGGGHAQAAGCTMDCPMDEALGKVLQAIDEEMKRHCTT